MNDPHVEALLFKVRHSERVTYDKAASLDHEEEGFKVHLDGGQAVFVMKSHHATPESAREAVEPFIRAWELSAALEYEPDCFALTYDHADVVDRSPTPGQTSIYVETAHIAISTGEVRTCVGRADYPKPPVSISYDPDVELMFEVYRQYHAKRRMLPDAAYCCLTFLQGKSGGRKAAVPFFRIDLEVLQTLADLTHEKGGAEARKAAGTGDDFSPNERNWIEAAIKLLIRRAAETAHDPAAPLPQITMRDLPNL